MATNNDGAVYLVIQHRNTSIFLDMEELSTVQEVKRILQGILKHRLEKQQLYKENQLLEDSKTMREYDIISQNSMPHAPAVLRLVLQRDYAESLGLTPSSAQDAHYIAATD